MTHDRYTQSIQYKPDDWAKFSAEFILKKIKEIVKKRGLCNLMLTGGSSAKKVYEEWGCRMSCNQFESVNFYFTDERNVPREDLSSNYGMAYRAFLHGIDGGNIFNIPTCEDSLERLAQCYENSLPDCIDLLIIGISVDGHIASLFPDTKDLLEVNRKIIFVRDDRYKYDRITITPKVLQTAKETIVLAPGLERGRIFNDIKFCKNYSSEVPASLVVTGTWLLTSPEDD
jgi:6-phosphogluconolactonase